MSLVTITTVGYDLNTKTLLGKLIGDFCALSGVFILRLPIPIVVNNFAQFYKNRLWRNEVEHKKRERMVQLAAEMELPVDKAHSRRFKMVSNR